jgi:hypothetical protein
MFDANVMDEIKSGNSFKALALALFFLLYL